MKPSVFIGSSSENLDIAYAIQQNIENDSEPTVWDQKIFGLSEFTLDSLTDKLDQFDFGIFVFSPDDKAIIRNQERPIVRDNIVLELGLFIGRLGRERTFIVAPKEIENFQLPTDLLGITIRKYYSDRSDKNLKAALSPTCHDIIDIIKNKGIKKTKAGLKGILEEKKLALSKEPKFLLDATEQICILGSSLKTIFWDDNKKFLDYLAIAGKNNVMIKILLLKPTSKFVKEKANEEGNKEVEYRRNIEHSIWRFINFKKNKQIPRFDLFLYDEFPVWFIIIIDDKFAKISYFYDKDAGEAPYYNFDNKGDYNLIKPFGIYLDKLAERSIKVRYLFDWNEAIKGNYTTLIDIVKQKLKIDCLNEGDININNDEIINITTKNEFISLNLIEDKTKVILKLNNIKKDEFYVIKENDDKLSLYG